MPLNTLGKKKRAVSDPPRYDWQGTRGISISSLRVLKKGRPLVSVTVGRIRDSCREREKRNSRPKVLACQ